MIAYILDRIGQVKNFFPEEHLQYCFEDGYDVDLSDDYSQVVQLIIHNYGKYWMALTKGTLKPFYPEQDHFMRVIWGEVPAKYPVVEG